MRVLRLDLAPHVLPFGCLRLKQLVKQSGTRDNIGAGVFIQTFLDVVSHFLNALSFQVRWLLIGSFGVQRLVHRETSNDLF